MGSYDQYKNTRDVAWQFLIDNQLTRFPIEPFKLLDKYNVTPIARPVLPELYALTFKVADKIVLLYNKNAPAEILRFTIMHELGHVILNHLNNSEQNEYMENEANIFASRVLMPMILIHEEHLITVAKISQFFGVSNEAAQIRLNRYNKIKCRQKFLNSALEKEYFKLYTQNKF